ncbi:MAG: flippase-like domain-containing protein [Magnetococcus sp. DMHC-1]
MKIFIQTFKNIHKKYLYKILGSFFLAIFILWAIYTYLGISPRVAWQTIIGLGWYNTASVIGLSFIIISLLAMKWKVSIKYFFPSISPVFSFFFTNTSVAFLTNIFVPHIGSHGVRIGILKKVYNVPISYSLAAQFMDQLSELILACIAVIPGILYLLGVINLFSALYLLISFLLLSPLFLKFTFHTCYKPVHAWINTHSNKILFKKRLFAGFSSLFNRDEIKNFPMTNLLLIGIARNLTTSLKNLLLMQAVGLSISFNELILVAPIVYFFGILSFLPAGIGVIDAGWLGILIILGYDKINIGKFLILELIVGSSAIAFVTITSLAYNFISGRLNKKNV